MKTRGEINARCKQCDAFSRVRLSNEQRVTIERSIFHNLFLNGDTSRTHRWKFISKLHSSFNSLLHSEFVQFLQLLNS